MDLYYIVYGIWYRIYGEVGLTPTSHGLNLIGLGVSMSPILSLGLRSHVLCRRFHVPIGYVRGPSMVYHVIT